MADLTIPRWPPLGTITPLSAESLGMPLRHSGIGLSTAASSAFPVAANRVYYYPFRIYETCLAVEMALVNGSTASGNLDIGIYDWEGNKIVSSGSTAQSGTSTFQVFNITDTILVPGKYFMAITHSNTTGTSMGFSFASGIYVPSGLFYMETTGAFGLPATATFGTNPDASPRVHCMAVLFDTTL
jgi:hypothetical protein